MKWPFGKIVVHKIEDAIPTSPGIISSSPNAKAIEKHIEKYIGKIHTNFHEILSDKTHLDIYWVKPTKEHNFNTLITCGMSDLAMTVPEGLEALKYLELAICLPADWDFNIKKEENYWPIRMLKDLARMPHDRKTFLTFEHSVVNISTDNTESYLPYSENTKLCASLIYASRFVDNMEFYSLKLKNKTINMFFVIPLYKEEVDFKVNNSTDALLELFDKKQIIAEIINPKRENVIL